MSGATKTVGKKKHVEHRNTIWRAAQAIGAGYKNAARDFQSSAWVLRYLVKTFGKPDHARLAEVTLEKMQDKSSEEQKQILVEAFAQSAAEARRKTDGWDEVKAILRSDERPVVATKVKTDRARLLRQG